MKFIFFKMITLIVFIFCIHCGSHIVYDVARELDGERDDVSVSQSNAELRIFVVDVGQGDATLVLGPVGDEGRVSLLIDAGALEPDGGEILTALFEELGLAELSHLIVSHYDGDHMGGLVNLWESSTSLLWDVDCRPGPYFPKAAIIDLGDSSKDTLSVGEYITCRDANLDLLGAGHITIGESSGENLGYVIDLGGDYMATIVAGNGYVIDSDERVAHVDTDNEKSIAVLITGPDGFTFLVTGDLTGTSYGDEDALVEVVLGEALKNRGIAVSILRTGHHGSGNASAAEFLQAIQPEVALISVGNNSHGHPHCEVLKRLGEYSEFIYQTGEGSSDEDCSAQDDVVVVNGTIWIRVYGGNYTIN